MFGIDAGGTYLKLGNPKEGDLELHPLPYSKEWLEMKLDPREGPFFITGSGTMKIQGWFPDLGLRFVPELQAIGLGGAYLSGKQECIVMNIGSGTPILYVDRRTKEVRHLGGTGMGSASLAGLSYYMTGISDLDRIDEKAYEGNADRVNLLISDIYEDPDLVALPGNVTASNFGKYQDWRHLDCAKKPDAKDLLAALHKMVAETIAVMANLASKQHGKVHLPVSITGGGTLNHALVKYLKISFEYLDQEFVIPLKAEFSTLYGLFVHEELLD